MAISATPSLVRNLKIFTSTLTAIPLALTAYRLIRRCAMRRFWWEDACAVVASISCIVCAVSSWLRLETTDNYSMVSFWIHAITYTIVVWSVRLSILLSLLHIMSPLLRLRRVMILVAALFVLMWSSLTISFAVRHASRRDATRDSSDTVERWLVAIFELLADILSDASLICLTIHSLRHMKSLQPSQRRLIIIAYSSSIFVTIISFVRAACQILDAPLLIIVAIDVEVACSLFVCNSLFFSILVYRLLSCYTANNADADTTSLNSRGTESSILQLTTIDLDVFTSMISVGVFTLPPAASCFSDDSEKYCQATLTVPPIIILEQ